MEVSKNSKIINLVYLTIIFVYIINNNKSTSFSNQIKNKYIYNNEKEEFLDLCYRSRSLFYIKQWKINESQSPYTLNIPAQNIIYFNLIINYS